MNENIYSYNEMPLYKKHIHYSQNNEYNKMKIIKWDSESSIRTHTWYDEDGNVKTVVKNIVKF